MIVSTQSGKLTAPRSAGGAGLHNNPLHTTYLSLHTQQSLHTTYFGVHTILYTKTYLSVHTKQSLHTTDLSVHTTISLYNLP